MAQSLPKADFLNNPLCGRNGPQWTGLLVFGIFGRNCSIVRHPTRSDTIRHESDTNRTGSDRIGAADIWVSYGHLDVLRTRHAYVTRMSRACHA